MVAGDEPYSFTMADIFARALSPVPCSQRAAGHMLSGFEPYPVSCDTRSTCGGGGGHYPLPVLPGGSFRSMLRMHQLCLLRDLGRFPRGFRWCWSMGPWLGTLQDGGVRVRTGFGDRGLARRISGCCEPSWLRWPGCCRWARWPMWDIVSTFP